MAFSLRKILGNYRATPPTLQDGQLGDPQLDSRANLHVAIYGADSTTGAQASASNSDSHGGAAGALYVRSFDHLYNAADATWQRRRNNQDITVLSSAARTATNQSSDIVNYNGRGLDLVIDVTAIAATPSVVFTIQGKDALSGQYYTILASAAISSVSTTVLRVYPGLTAAANTVANFVLPRTWRVDAAHGDADSITYSVGASVVL